MAAPASPSRSELGAEFWDPPCRVCKLVDDEPNVLCELCNAAYHLACIENRKPPLPRSPEDDEWFCRPCIKRGVPECILDRAGRDASAYFLIKWLGRESWDVSWEDAKTLDTPWCRRLVRDFVASEPSRRATAPLLPPSHPLVDRLRTRIEIKCDDLKRKTRPLSENKEFAQLCGEKPSAEQQELAHELFDQMRVLCKLIPCRGHLLGRLMEETIRLLALLDHPQCDSLAPWGDGPAALRQVTPFESNHDVGPVTELQVVRQETHSQLLRAATALGRAYQNILSGLGIALPSSASSETKRRKGASGHIKEQAVVGRAFSAISPAKTDAGLVLSEFDGFRLQLSKCASGYRGVTINGSKFAASARHDGKHHYIGTFATAVEAAVAVAKFYATHAGASPKKSTATTGSQMDGRNTPEGKVLTEPQKTDLHDRTCKVLIPTIDRVVELSEMSQPGHMLGPVVREVAKLVVLMQGHPECELMRQLGAVVINSPPMLVNPHHQIVLFPTLSCLKQGHPECEFSGCASLELQGAQDAAREAVRSLLDLRQALQSVFGPAPVKTVALRPNTYHGFLLHLRERRPQVRVEQPRANAREIEQLIAAEWSAMDSAGRQAVIERAVVIKQKVMQSAEGAALERDDETRSVNTNRNHRKRLLPCTVCLEPDCRDAVVCATCQRATHLMCMFPPLEAVPSDFVCISCRASLPPPPSKPQKGDTIEVEVKEHDDLSLHIGAVHGQPGEIIWKRAVCLEGPNIFEINRLEKTKRFMCCVNEEDDFIEEFGMEDEGTEWRWPADVHAKHAARVQAARAGAVEVAREKNAIAERIRIDTEAPAHPWLGHVEQLYREGLCVVETGISEAAVQMCFDIVDNGYKRYMNSIKTLDLQEKLQDVGFMEIKMRSGGRYDLQLPELMGEEFSFLRDDAPWMPLVKATLGGDAQLVHSGCMLSFPGSATQPWHSDGPHIRSGGSASFVAPPHALNVFVPLIDVTIAHGPTEFVPGSQFDFDVKNPTCSPTVKAGHALLFDYRLKHRGHGNSASEARPLLYMTYARPFFFDVYNFDRKRYSRLPMVEDRGSREDRMQKRQST